MIHVPYVTCAFIISTLIVISNLIAREGCLRRDNDKVNGVLKLCLQCVDKNNIGHLEGFGHKVHE
ncbi:hypothetical protein VISI1226_00215 [Vibrio sinaloensis DSM 21326]|uniref:Uncharacterized protein n=1 Tax=Vibrio sinaloensis DSM 21326 TaxID=945550 RepID=E8M5Z2_PHOS4|nr:hypothetical protein VISI1226_00215 [Vibrio sinaloensis DSM 21326]